MAMTDLIHGICQIKVKMKKLSKSKDITPRDKKQKL